MNTPHSRTPIVYLASTAASLALVVASALPAFAATSSDASENSLQNCALNLDTLVETCADADEDLSDAIYEKTGDIVATTPDTIAPLAFATTSATTRSAAAATSATQIMVAKFWDKSDYSGNSFFMYRSSGCTSSASPAGAPNIGSSWYGRVSSFKGYSGCRVKVWSNTSYSGSSYGYAASASSLGSMDNKTKSVKVKD